MAKHTTSIEIVVSTNKGLSSMGHESRQAVHALLALNYSSVRMTVVNDRHDVTKVIARAPDLVFLGMKFVPSNALLGLSDPSRLWLSKQLSQAGILHTGSDHRAAKLEHTKHLAKQVMKDKGLATAAFQVIRYASEYSEADITLSYPIFIKPLDRGGGAGIDDASLVHTFAQLQTKVAALAQDMRADALLEEYLPGREFSVGILRQTGSDDYTVMPIEIIAPVNKAGDRFLSGSIKSADVERTQAVTDPLLRARINKLALRAFHALGAKDYGRIDIRLDAAGNPHFLEANLLPSLLNNYGNFPKTCLLNNGITHETLINQIVTLALEPESPYYDGDELARPLDAPLLASVR